MQGTFSFGFGGSIIARIRSLVVGPGMGGGGKDEEQQEYGGYIAHLSVNSVPSSLDLLVGQRPRDVTADAIDINNDAVNSEGL